MAQKGKPQEGRRKPPAADDEAELFRDAMAGARPLRSDKVEPTRRRPRASARFSRLDEQQVLRESLKSPPGTIDIALDGALGSALVYRHPSVNRKTLRRLARGGISVQRDVDLHGLNATEAKEVLRDFIEHSLRLGHTCVRVVHGKGRGSGHGGPVLKGKVDHWLRHWEQVLAFVSARQEDGGTGAVYVLLKKL